MFSLHRLGTLGRANAGAAFLLPLLCLCALSFPARAEAAGLPLQGAQGSQGSQAPQAGGELAAARALVEAGKLEEGITRLKEIALEHPEMTGVARELGIAYYRKEAPAEAIPFLERALTEQPGDREPVQLLGLSYFRTGKPGKAIPLLERVDSWYPAPNLDAAYVLGIAYLQTRDFPRARRAFARMYGVPPDSAASHLFLARMLLRQGYDPMVEEEAMKAAALDPRLPGPHFLLGELYMYKSRLPEAIAAFEKELEINPSSATAYYKLADAHTRAQDFDKAHRLLQQSIWLDQTASGPFVLLGKVLLRKGETELAVDALRQAAAMDPNNVMAHHLLGEAYRKLGRPGDAERELRTAQRLRERPAGN